MKITLEQVEQLREKSGVSYMDARTALEQSEGDLLGALIWLEQQGKFHTEQGGFYTTQSRAETSVPALPVQQESRRKRWKLKELLSMCWHALTDNELEIWRKGEKLSSVPLLILMSLLVLGFWCIIPALVIGLFLGCRYTFAGPKWGRKNMEDLADLVSDAADQIKSGLRGKHQE